MRKPVKKLTEENKQNSKVDSTELNADALNDIKLFIDNKINVAVSDLRNQVQYEKDAARHDLLTLIEATLTDDKNITKMSQELARMTKLAHSLSLELSNSDQVIKQLHVRYGQMLVKSVTAAASIREKDREKLVKLFKKLNIVDAEWYVANYPDVAGAKIDPVEHYVFFGSVEGRLCRPFGES